jgi:hypothetical protein
VPPKYKREDFLKTSYWNQRGKLDVPKERFVSYPMASPDSDDSPLLGWAGWDHPVGDRDRRLPSRINPAVSYLLSYRRVMIRRAKRPVSPHGAGRTWCDASAAVADCDNPRRAAT